MSFRTLIFCIIVTSAISLSHRVIAEPLPDTCLTLNWSGFSSNPDSIYVDTCLTTHRHPVFWDKGPYEIFFDTDVIKLGYGAPDSNLEVGWEAIDTAFPAIRSLFETIADSIGPFLLKKIEPADTSDVSSRDFLMIFENYVPNDSVMSYSNRVPGLTFNLMWRPVMNYLPDDYGLIPGAPIDEIQMTSPDHFWPNNYHGLGWQWNLYKMKCPMAWEITQGGHKTTDPYVVIVDPDSWASDDNGDLVPLISTDIFERTTSIPGGNFLYLTAGHTGSGDPQNPGDGHNDVAVPLSVSHGGVVVATAVALGDNDDTRPTSFAPMVGVAYNSGGVGTNWDTYGALYLDVDGKNDGVITRPVAMNESYLAGSDDNNKTAMDDGIVVVAAVGNNNTYDAPGTDKTHEDVGGNSPFSSWTFDPDGTKVYVPFSVYPSAQAWPDATDATKDLKVIAVGGTMDGTEPCWPSWSGPEQSESNWDYGPGTTKFPAPTASTTTRQSDEEAAYVDLVAPGAAMIVPGSLAEPGDPPHFTAYGHEYNPNEFGTSLSAPEVAGVVALTRAVSRNYSTVQTGGSLLSLSADDIQRRAYNILTFTATKIPDFQNFSSTRFQQCTSQHWDAITNQWVCDSYEWERYQNSVQFNYVNQGPNDPLDRSWAQRVGFGEVNAYRAVANSIPLSAKMVYSEASSDVLDFTHATTNEHSQFLMHMGAYRPSNGYRPTEDSYSGAQTNGNSIQVLTAGGITLPRLSEPWTENQGATFLYSSGGTPIALTVGDSPDDDDNDILAIDGEVIGDGLAANKITALNDGKILITGYLQDVAIVSGVDGPVKVDDLIIYAYGTSGYSNVTINSNSSNPFEIYGDVQLQDNGKFNLNGYLTIQPGGEVDLDGNYNFEISSGGHVTMNASSKIATTFGREVLVDNGGTLEISGLLPVNILCTLIVEPGGTLVIDGGADLQLDQFRVSPGGTITVEAGGRLTLNKMVTSICQGTLQFEGSGSSRCTLTGGVSQCGTVNQLAAITVEPYPLKPLTQSAVNATWLSMEYTDDSDVIIKVIDARKNTFDADHFSANRRFPLLPGPITPTPGITLAFPSFPLLNILNSALAYPGLDPVANYWLLNTGVSDGCRFFDEAGAPSSPSPATDNFFYSGIWVQNQLRAVVDQSYFYDLAFGAYAKNCTKQSYFEGNLFGTDPLGAYAPVHFGIYETGSNGTFCQNGITNFDLGLSASSDLRGFLYFNTFTGPGSGWGISTQSGGEYDLVGNGVNSWTGFGAFSYGTGNEIRLSDKSVGAPNPILYGRNIFQSEPTPYRGVVDLSTLKWPFTADKNHGTFAVSCGFNDFQPNAFSQMAGPTGYSVVVDNNKWEVSGGGCATVPVGGMTMTVNVPGTICTSEGATNECGDQNDMTPCTPISMVVADFYPSKVTWASVDSSGPTARSYFTNASSMLLNVALDSDTRRAKARDELIAATLIDSIQVYLPLVLNDYRTVLGNPVTSPSLASSILMLKGEVHELLGQDDSAIACYNLVESSYTAYSDSIYALWALQNLSAFADTMYDTSFDTSRSSYMQRVANDLLAMVGRDSTSDTLEGGAGKIADGHPMENNAGLQVTVHPNPATISVQVCVEDVPGGVPVVVDVVNEIGAPVATLYNATPEAELGLCLTLDCSRLPNGVYYADLQTEGMHHAVKFTVAH